LKIPPFGKPLKALLDAGALPNNSIYLYIGKFAWQKGKSSSICRPARTLILPSSERPIDYMWPVRDCDILIIETSPQKATYIEDVVYILFKHEAFKVTVITVDFIPTVYKRDF
jgi:hypothetical protein